MSFVPRTHFLERVKATWFPGHMHVAMREMRQLINTTDLIIEVRDARIPLSSRNPQFTSLLEQRPRIIVYNKIDLSCLDTKVVRGWDNHPVVVQDSKHNVTSLLNNIKALSRDRAISVQGMRILVIGMPNVGKSTMLNALRHASLGRSKAAKTGGQPGITRSTNSIFKLFDDPLAYLVDTPGIMIPFVPNSMTLLKLGLVNCIKDSIIDVITLADYLLFELNLRDRGYTAKYNIETNDIHELLDMIGKKSGKLKRGGIVDHDAAARIFIQAYRDGQLGSFCLDEVHPDALKERIEEEGRYLSKSQVRRGMEATL